MPKQPYFFHPAIDATFAGGLSLAALAAFFASEGPVLAQSSLEASLILLWFVNWPHFSATLYRLYHSTESRWSYPFTTFVSPVFFIAIAALILLVPQWASIPVHLYALWAPFHFSSQSIGISFIYARRSQLTFSLWERRSFVWFCHSAFLAMTAKVESLNVPQRFGVISYPSLNIPPILVPITSSLFIACTAFWIWMGIRSWRIRGRSFPLIVCLPVISQVLWFSIGPYSPSFNQLVPMFHSLQYLPIVWWMQMQAVGYSRSQSFHWLRANFLGGALLFWGIPVVISRWGFSLDLTRVAVFTAINLHHFYVDGIIWKLRNSQVSSRLTGQLIPAV